MSDLMIFSNLTGTNRLECLPMPKCALRKFGALMSKATCNATIEGTVFHKLEKIT